MTTESYFGDLPEEFKEYCKERLHRLDQIRAGSIFPESFEDGMRYVYCQILQEMKREKEIIEAYTELMAMAHKRFYIVNDLCNKHRDAYREREKDV